MGLKKAITVAVHDGVFHADECFALATLKLLFEVSIVRTRDVIALQSADMRVDVGYRYDPATGDFDHHQPDVPYRQYGSKYAAFGLVWREFGEKICVDASVARRVDELLVEPNDAADNGDILPVDQGPTPFTVASMIETLNPTWLEHPAKEQPQFDKAVRLAGKILKRAIAVCRAEVDSVSLIHQAEAEAVDKRLIVLDKNVPWQKTVTGMGSSDIRYVVYPEGKYWAARSVQLARSIKPKYPFPLDWAGKHGEALAALSGVPDALFCHSQRFIATAQSLDGARLLAKIALG